MSGLNGQNGSAPKGNVREVVLVAWPIVISMLSYTAMGVVDTLFVGWLGTTELAAVGIATTAFFLCNAFFMGLLRGVKVLSAQLTGAKKHDLAVAVGWLGALVAVPCGLVVLALSLLDGPLFAALGGPPEVQAIARDYFGIRAWGAGFWYVTIALCGYFQGAGDTQTPMKINLVANAANVVLDPILIFGFWIVPAVGVEGAAIATVIAQALGMVVVLVLMARRAGLPRRPAWHLGRKIVSLGVPMGVHGALGVGGFTVFTALLARMGEDQLAAHQVALKIISVSFLPGYGLSETASILTGQYTGARNNGAARRAFRSSMLVAVGIMGACGAVFFVWSDALIRVFNTDPDVVRIGGHLLIVAAFFQVFDAVAMVATGALNGTGDTRFTMWTGVACSWLVLVPLAYTFGYALGWGAVGAWLGLTCEIAIVAAITLWRFYGTGWEAAAE